MAGKVTGNLATVYAAALYEVAREAHALQQVEEELRLLRDLLNKDLTLRRFFETPTVTPAKKRTVIEGALKELSTCTRNFLSVLVRKQRVGLLNRIVEAFHELANEKAGVAEMTLESARPFEAAEKEKLFKTLTSLLGRKVVFQERVRPELLGGFVLRHKDRQWDTSLISRLDRLVNRMKIAKEALGVWKE